MPTASVPNSGIPADAVTKKIAELEAGSAEITSVTPVGDQIIITYKAKPRVGRPPKETRG